MNISIIVAVSENNVIGVQNQLPWHLPADLKYFKHLTTGYPIIMGRKTFDSIGKPLPNRENIVLTQNHLFAVDGVLTFHSVDEVLDYCKNKNEVFVIGGNKIFKLFLNRSNTIYRTVVHTKIPNGDTFFSDINRDEWTLVKSDFHTKDEKNIFRLYF
ncbi:MAG: dihydrofolate reductase [Bacteroidetes bacterium OLB11]|nr:MAG: dihydrofolate reductase [Bacteroidetes bacterium OLB11]